MNKYKMEKFKDFHRHQYLYDKTIKDLEPAKRWYRLFLNNKSYKTCCGKNKLTFREIEHHKCIYGNCEKIKKVKGRIVEVCMACKGIDNLSDNWMYFLVALLISIIGFLIVYSLLSYH